MRLEDLKAYEIISGEQLTDIESKGTYLRHKKTGAKVVVIENDDDNKVFCIGFRTPPTDSTGVPHILEHSVLCGSDKYPLKDPFVELAKSSLNTFLNAMTYPDKTVYPVASCNEKDFENLMDVYLDAVFYPNIHHEEKIFRQEGWHYEMNAEDDELTINGVVYNEMKGVFSSPDDVLRREIMNSLYPDTTYAVESGGDPNNIPDLTYEAFLDFHKRYYHPSNSYIYLYGDADMAERLTYIDEAYLSKFEALSIDSEIKDQAAFKEPKYVLKEYPVMDEEPLENNTYLSYNVSIGPSTNLELALAIEVIDYALCSSQGAPLKERLIKEGIGNDVSSETETGIKQMYFSVIAKNAEKEQEEKFVSIIKDELSRIIKTGYDKKALTAAVNTMEFRYREADFGSYPKGLVYGLDLLDSWLYDDSLPFINVKLNATYQYLRSMIETDYFEKLTEKLLLNNTHVSVVTMVPKHGLLEAMEKEQKEKLAAYKASLSKKEIKDIVKNTKALKKYQETEDSEELKACLPHLTRADIRKEIQPLTNEEMQDGDLKILYHDINTCGIDYIRMLFDVTDLDPEELMDINILMNLFGYVDTEHYSYGELYNDTNIYMGGMDTSMSFTRLHGDKEDYRIFAEVSFKALPENTKKAFEIVEETVLRSKFDDATRITETLLEFRSRMQSSFISSGHSFAISRLMGYFDECAALMSKCSRYEQYNYLEALEKDKDSFTAHIKEVMPKLVAKLYASDRMLLDYTGSREQLTKVITLAQNFRKNLKPSSGSGKRAHIDPVKRNEGFQSAAQVNYVAVGGNFVKKGYSYTGAFEVLKVIMGYDYLWNNIRVKGGAYGCMTYFRREGSCLFVSYRDPHIRETLKIYEKIVPYLKKYNADEETMTKFVIGAFSNLDMPLSPSAKGLRSSLAYLSGITEEILQRERDEVLNVTVEDIRKLAEPVKAALSFDCVCTVGNAGMIADQADLFMEVKPIFNNSAEN